MIGTTVSHYRVLEELGAGGMGVVYLAEDERLHRKVALKFLAPASTADAAARARLQLEAQAASTLDHPNIATIFEIGEWEGQLFIAMAYYPGDTLKARIDQGPLALEQVTDVARQIATGLAAAHAAGVVHRDLKPANIIITPAGQVKVLDFGLAKVTATDRETVTKMTGIGVTVGTLAYMAPEQAHGRDVDARADVWSLGVVVYEMLAGRRPFQADSSAGLLIALLTEAPVPLASRRADVPPELDRIVSRALVKEPAQRTLTAADIVRELTASVPRASVPGPVRGWPRRLVPLLIGLVAAAVAIGWFVKRGADRRAAAARNALPEIQRLIERDDYLAAVTLATETEAALRGDPALAALWERMTEIGSVRTDPLGADVAIRDAHLQSDWRALGRTPIENARIPRGVLRWRIQKAGFQTVELIGGTGRILLNALPQPIVLTPTGTAPPEMVRIPNGPLALTLTGYNYNKTIPSPAYLLDRYEVTNKDYKAFVDAGGYEKREYWTQPFVRDGVERSVDEALAGFRDQTGRPGPSTWEVGTYPQGQDDYPVGGVSWYEAAAYAQFRGKSLPTIYHWARAAGSFTASSVTPLSNFGGRGPMAVGRNQGLTQAGLYDMAGNVKEWCWNETKPGGTRYALGGSWQDPDHVFIYGDARSPFDRSATNGFRCARFDAPGGPPAATLLPVAAPVRNYADERPVSNEIFNVYKTLYGYDPAPLAATIDRVDDTSPHWRKEKVSFNASYGKERVPAYLFLPKNAKPPYQTILFWPGSTAVRTASSEPLAQIEVIDFLVMSGRAVLYPVYSGTYERRTGRESTWPEPTRAYRDWVMRQVGDARRSLDYLQSRPDIRGDAIGYYGFSWGARTGSIVLAVEPRLRAAAFLAGGFSGAPPPEVDPFNFAPHVSVPVLMVNGDTDFIFVVERAQKPLFAALGAAAEHKRHVMLPGGHGIIYEKRSQAIREILDWFDRYLGAVK